MKNEETKALGVVAAFFVHSSWRLGQPGRFAVAGGVAKFQRSDSV
jgi:hypothetical protein